MWVIADGDDHVWEILSFHHFTVEALLHHPVEKEKKYKNKEINTLSLVNIMAWDIFRHLVLYFTFCINWASHSEGVELVTSSGNIASYIKNQLT